MDKDTELISVLRSNQPHSRNFQSVLTTDDDFKTISA